MDISKLDKMLKTEKRQKIENREQTDRETNYRGHSNCQWIAGLSGPIIHDIPYNT